MIGFGKDIPNKSTTSFSVLQATAAVYEGGRPCLVQSAQTKHWFIYPDYGAAILKKIDKITNKRTQIPLFY